MPLAPTTRLGPYEIIAIIGAGGMGEVYQARDTRLNRVVAVKILREQLLEKPQMRERFDREARVISTLNHPHICTLHDVGHENGVAFLVMEYLKGETLESRLSKSPLPLDQALRYAIEIVEALEQAHRQGIIHRDLKPGNIMLTSSGIKLLDFGLAKLQEAVNTVPEHSTATEALSLTGERMLVGTLQYMAPEQLNGNEADVRTDIFAFGVVIYEMVTRRRAFTGESQASLIAAIIERDPPAISKLQPMTPHSLDRIVRTCLAKNPDERWQSARDLWLELKWTLDELSRATPKDPKRISRWPIWAAAALLALLAAASAGFWLGRTRPRDSPRVNKLTYSGLDYSPAASPDGRTIAFTSGRDGLARIWLKDLERGDEVALTSGNDSDPRFSPDGSTILFTRKESGHQSLYRVATLGGEPRKLIDEGSDGDWSPDGREITFVRTWEEERLKSSLLIATASGGMPREIAHFEGREVYCPRWSPKGNTVASILTGPTSTLTGESSILLVEVHGLNGKTVVKPPKGRSQLHGLIWLHGGGLAYLQTEVINASGTSVVLQDSESGLASSILQVPQYVAGLDVVSPGRLVLGANASTENLREISLKRALPLSEARWLTHGDSSEWQPVYAPSGDKVLFSSNRSGIDLWEVSITSGALHRLTDDPAIDWHPSLTPDGKNLLWASKRSGHYEVWIAAADGSGARQLTEDGVDAQNATSTPDGWIVYKSTNPAKTGLWKIRPDGSAATRFFERETQAPEVSPDGKYVAYISKSSVHVVNISDGSSVPFEIRDIRQMHWMPNGKAIAVLGTNEKGVPGVFQQDFIPGRDTSKTRRVLGGFDPNLRTFMFAISPDGSRMIVSSRNLRLGLLLADHVPGVIPAQERKH